MYELLDPETKMQRSDSTFFVLHYLLSVDVVLCVSSELCPLGIALHKSTTPGWMQAEYGSWIRWLVSRTRSDADKLGGGGERDTVQRRAKRYDDDGDGKDVELRLPLLAAVIAEGALPSQTN